MITAVDTSVLLDVFGADATYGLRSREAVRRNLAEGRLIACEVVWAEVSTAFGSSEAARKGMQRLSVEFVPLELDTALYAGHAWQAYRARGGTRVRVAADFLIGAHAQLQADRLLTRDHGFFRASFRGLRAIEPPRP